MIGLVLGNTQLGSLIVKKLKKLNIKFTIIDISKKKYLVVIKIPILYQSDSLVKPYQF